MAKNASDRIIEGLTTLLQGFSDLEDMIETDYGTTSDDEEFSSHMITEISAAIETVIEDEDYTPEYIASVVSALMGALEELDPDIFAKPDDLAAEVESDDDEDDDYDDDEDDSDED